MDIVTAATTAKPEDYVSDKPLPIKSLSPKQKKYIKWLASLPAEGLKTANGTIAPLPVRIKGIENAIKKHIIAFKKAKSPFEKWGHAHALRSLRSGLWMHQQAASYGDQFSKLKEARRLNTALKRSKTVKSKLKNAASLVGLGLGLRK